MLSQDKKETLAGNTLKYIYFSLQLPLFECTCVLLAQLYQTTAECCQSSLVQQSGLLWLTLTATVAKHSAHPTTADVLTVFNGAWPVHCGFKAPLCFASC